MTSKEFSKVAVEQIFAFIEQYGRIEGRRGGKRLMFGSIVNIDGGKPKFESPSELIKTWLSEEIEKKFMPKEPNP